MQRGSAGRQGNEPRSYKSSSSRCDRRISCTCAMPSTASFTCRVCAWWPARRPDGSVKRPLRNLFWLRSSHRTEIATGPRHVSVSRLVRIQDEPVEELARPKTWYGRMGACICCNRASTGRYKPAPELAEARRLSRTIVLQAPNARRRSDLLQYRRFAPCTKLLILPACAKPSCRKDDRDPGLATAVG